MVDDVVLFLLAAERLRRERIVGTFARIVEAPVEPVDIQVHDVAPRRSVPHGRLRVAEPLIASVERIAQGAVPAPAVVEVGANDDRVELRRAILAKQRIPQFPGAILILKQQSQRVLLRERSRRRSVDPQPGVDLEAFRPVGVDQLRGCRPLPGDSLAPDVRVDAARAEEVGVVERQRQRRDRLEAVLNQRRVDAAEQIVRPNDVWIHTVIGRAPSPGGGKAGVQSRLLRLLDDVAREDVRLRIDVGRRVAQLESRCANIARLVDQQRPRIEHAVDDVQVGVDGRRRSVRRVDDRRACRRRRDLQVERRRVETAIDAEGGVFDDSGEQLPIRGARRRCLEVAGNDRCDHLGDAARQSRNHQHVAAARLIERVDRQDVDALPQIAQLAGDVEVDVARQHDLVAALARGDRVVTKRAGSIRRGDQRPVEIGDEPVVVDHPQIQRIKRRRIGDVEREPRVGGRSRPWQGNVDQRCEVVRAPWGRLVADAGRAQRPGAVVVGGHPPHGISAVVHRLEVAHRRGVVDQRRGARRHREPIGNVSLLRRRLRGELLHDGRAVRLHQREILAVGRYLEVRMELACGRVRRLVGREDDDRRFRRDHGPRRKRPLRQVVVIVG